KAERDLCALLHDVAEMPGEHQLAAAGNPRRLDEEYVAADRRPGEAGRDAGNAGAGRELALELACAEDALDVLRIDPDVIGRSFREPHGHVAQHGADLALEIADAGFAR